MSRYNQLLQVIDLFRPQTICETGVWNGHNAIRMIKQAEQYNKLGEVSYYGFDLFEDATPETDSKEFNVKPHNSCADVGKLIREHTNTALCLIKGDTNKTLGGVCLTDFTQFDLAFIDGGHSIDTIRNDYHKLRDSKVIILDDYYTHDEEGKCPDIEKFGCNRLLHEIRRPHVVLPLRDRVAGGGYTQFVMVL